MDPLTLHQRSDRRPLYAANNHTATKRERRESKERYLGGFLLVAVGSHNAATTVTSALNGTKPRDGRCSLRCLLGFSGGSVWCGFVVSGDRLVGVSTESRCLRSCSQSAQIAGYVRV